MANRTLALLGAALLLAMGLWFGVSAVAPQVAREWGLGGVPASLTLAVQIGFVAGTLLSATLNLPDVVSARRLMVIAALAAATVNLMLALFARDVRTAVVLRFLTGVCLAAVYPPAMKVVATWFRSGRGFALGALIGALTLGKASPYLAGAFGSESWRLNVAFLSLLAVMGALIVLIFVRDGPYALPNQPFDITQAGKVFRNRGVRLANFGYFGHMWELYAMWTWFPVMLRASAKISGDSARVAEAGAFLVIGAGAVGCVAAGLIADRVGRPIVAAAAMAASGTCSLLIGLLFGRPALLLLVVAAIWGATIVADSAQFSACVTELGDPRYVGTALTMQTSIGFLITTVSIGMMPRLVETLGWRWSFATLAPGPLLGIVAMLRLQRLMSARATSSRPSPLPTA